MLTKKFHQRTDIALTILWAAILTIIGYLTVVMVNSFIVAKEHAEETTVTLAHLIANHDNFSISRASGLIVEVIDHLEYNDFNGNISPERRAFVEDVLFKHRDRLPGVASFTIIAKDGIRKFGVVNKNFTDLSKRPYFIALRDGTSDTYISHAEEGLASGKTGIHVAQRYMHNGEFAGVVVINLAVGEVFHPFYSSLDIGKNSSITLRDRNKLIIRYPNSAGLKPGEKINNVVSDRILEGDVRGTEEIESPFDGIKRIVSFEQLEGTNVYAAVGLSMEDVYAQSIKEAGGAILAMMVSIFAGLLATKAMRQSEKKGRELAESLSFIKHMAHHDALTGLPNRNYLLSKFAEMCSQKMKTGDQLALIFVDLDNFKGVNDTLGHAAGDSLLVQVAQRIQKSVYPNDIVSRHGGDEFIIIHNINPNAPDSADRVCWNVLDAFKDTFLIEGESVASGASLGAAIFPDHGKDFDELSRKSDVAMYKSKAQGRGVHTVYYPGLEDEAAREKLRLHSGLLTAIENHEFELYYEPLIDAQTNEVCGAEALIRWVNSGGEVIPANKFIAIAEESGLIIQIGEIVLDEACRAISVLRNFVSNKFVMSVNVSAVQFNRSNIEATVRRALEAYNVPATSLQIEITETVLMLDTDVVRKKISALRDMGISICIDDFGTGYSSLSYLRKYPIDKIKIDQSFAKEIEDENHENRALVLAIIQMAKALGYKTVAEGVETEEAGAIFREIGCCEVQGYFYTKPLPLNALIDFVSAKFKPNGV